MSFLSIIKLSMKKLNWNTVRPFIKKYRVGDYLRQFSIVAGGVIVTFWGSALITQHARQQEVRSTMQLVTKELQYNREALQGIKMLTNQDIHMSLLLIENNLVLSGIPADTLYTYKKFFSNLTNFHYRNDALEVLKGSSLMQYISDKQLLQNILQVYYRLENMQKNINNYYSLKEKTLQDLFFSRKKEDLIQTLNKKDNFFDNVSYLMNQPSFLNYVVIVPSFLNWQELEKLDQNLNQQICILEEKY